MNALKVGIVGIGGIGKVHLKHIRLLEDKGRVKLVAACDNAFERNKDNLKEFLFEGIRSYTDFDEFLEKEKELDFVVLATPIPLHRDMCKKALNAGNNVFLEKPPAVTIQDIDDMISAKKKTDKICGVAFQHTSVKSFVELKKGLLSGKIGEIKRISAMGLWKRTQEYFSRSPWVGKKHFLGNYVLDGTLNNPFAHLINNCLILANLQQGCDSTPVWVKGELYKSNNIESEDTSGLKVMTKGGVEILFLTSICSYRDYTPYILIEGTKGKAFWNYEGVIEYRDADNNTYESMRIESDPFEDHYKNFVDYLAGDTDVLSCPLEITRNFVLASNLAFYSSGDTHRVDRKYIEFYNGQGEIVKEIINKDEFVYLKDIEKVMEKCIKEYKLYSEVGAPWAVETSPYFSEGFERFELFNDK